MKKHHEIPESSILTETGLSEKEAAIYLAALESGGSTITELARTAGIERTGIYYHLSKLLDKGLLKTTIQGKRSLFAPADPDRITQLVQQKQKDLLAIMPELQTKYLRTTAQPIVEYFQGTEEIDSFYDRVYGILRDLEGDDTLIYVLGNSYKTLMVANKAFHSYEKPEEQINIRTKCILPRSQRPKDGMPNLTDPYIVSRYNLPPAEIRYIADRYKYPGSLVITKNHTILYDFQNTFFSITQNANLAATWRMFFEYIWDTLKRA